MDDILFDITTREIVLRNNDFDTTDNPSVQNGGILLYGRGMNPLLPMYGIGLIPEVIDGNTRDLVYELNRWQAMALLDGATLAKWSANGALYQGNFIVDVNYL